MQGQERMAVSQMGSRSNFPRVLTSADQGQRGQTSQLVAQRLCGEGAQNQTQPALGWEHRRRGLGGFFASH